MLAGNDTYERCSLPAPTLSRRPGLGEPAMGGWYRSVP
jgi:hypothetical protein